jgi:two-component system sensor histidine kinase KdpD
MYTLRDPTIELTAETRNRLLANVEAEADRLVHAVTSALALRSLENGLSPHWERMEPSEVVSAALDRCLPALGSRQITFQVPDDLPELWMDAALLDQALTALFENVAVHTPAGSPLEIDGCLQNNDLVVRVSDAGPGVPADVRERIFDRYERLDRTQAGVGLGLAIARAAVEAQGGRLCVADSKLGGACFTILIPQAVQGRR